MLASGYVGLPNHKSVRYGRGHYVDGAAHTNGIESFGPTIKRVHEGTFHSWSKKHIHRYVNELVGHPHYPRAHHHAEDGLRRDPANREAADLGAVDRRIGRVAHPSKHRSWHEVGSTAHSVSQSASSG